MTTKLTVLGTSARFATKERACSGYLLDVDGHRLWLDAGPGTWRNLLAHCPYDEVEGVVITHRHPDHALDVFQMEHALLYGPRGPQPPMPLWAPAETLDALAGFKELDAFDSFAIAGGEGIEFADATLRFVSMAHPPETVGIRVQTADGVVAYSADSGEDADFAALAGGADLFLCEASNQDSDEIWEGHLRASQAGRIASDAGVRRLVLTHLPAERDLGMSLEQARRTAGDLPIQLAADGDVFEVGG